MGNDISGSLIIWFIDTPTWKDELLTQLVQSGFETKTITSFNNLQTYGLTDRPAGLLVAATNFQENNLEGLSQFNACPRILVTATETSNQSAEHLRFFDFILAPHPPLFEHQLKSIIHISQKARAATEQLKERDAKLQHLHQEIEQQKRTNDEIEILKNAIVRNVSHELKTPLLQVKSAVSLLAEDMGPSKLIDYATDATARLELLVKNITLLGSSLDINPGPVIVRDAIENARRNLRRIWQRKDETDRIQVLIQEGLPPALADRQGLSTALQLLIDNALKFSKDNVEVCAERSGEFIQLTIQDSGIGIARDQLDSIFDLFYQVDHSSTRRYGGTGVGLAIVKLILEHHNSKIVVESKENLGSTFSFKLPLIKL